MPSSPKRIRDSFALITHRSTASTPFSCSSLRFSSCAFITRHSINRWNSAVIKKSDSPLPPPPPSYLRCKQSIPLPSPPSS
ncbi:hypothetical protein CEXT_443741 [Caerostris extrusa]|uniref:Uncharacterized protein n=1 Tax=Caerostris extrusa TaxID=172846 RepID=A0AAV4XW64_CAEEX|nr:hypothetical protein CEXT_443741 [Caerostris extrusa]